MVVQSKAFSVLAKPLARRGWVLISGAGMILWLVRAGPSWHWMQPARWKISRPCCLVASSAWMRAGGGTMEFWKALMALMVSQARLPGSEFQRPVGSASVDLG